MRCALPRDSPPSIGWSKLELERPAYVANGPDRCFHCKSELYEIAEQKRSEWQLEVS